ncbi:MAG: XRE family transcriptional regulator [Pseudonocardiales bacterium]|nr:XRE family transcriptional regulator [Pseudonocardiales bacterium]
MANDRFRAARERTASLTYPDEGLSRQELAELVNTYIWEHHHEMVALDANYVGKIERGIIRWPRKLYREALRVILGAATETAVGFINPRRAVVKLDNVKRQQFLHTTTLLGVGTLSSGPVAALLEGSEPTPVPSRVDTTEIEQIRTATRVFESWCLTYGGGLGREAVLAQLRWSADLLDASCPDRLRPELFRAVGDLAWVAGFMAFDHCAHGEARRVFGFALSCAEQATDWHLRAGILGDMALAEVWAGRPDEALTLTEYALVRADDRLTATGRAMLHTYQGLALAKMRRVRETLVAVGTADDHFAHSTPADDPPFMTFWNAGMQAETTGQALADLAMPGCCDPAEATNRLTTAVAGYLPGHARCRAFSLTKLASLTMATGDPLQAVTIGTAALDAVGTIRSRRALEGLRELNRHAAAHQDIDAVAHLRHQIGTLVLTS